MTDTEFLDLLLTIRLPFVQGNGKQIAIRFADVPEVLRSDFDLFMTGVACPTIAGDRCALQSDWDRFLYQTTAKHHKKMRQSSLALGIDGPTPADLDRAPLLTNWIAVWHPTWRDTVLVGTPKGHPVCLGPVTRTSPVCGMDPQGRWARTQSRWYRLLDASTLQAVQAAFPSQLRGARTLNMTEVQMNIEMAREDAGLF